MEAEDCFCEDEREAFGATILGFSSALGSTFLVSFGADAVFLDAGDFLFPDEGEAFGVTFFGVASALDSTFPFVFGVDAGFFGVVDFFFEAAFGAVFLGLDSASDFTVSATFEAGASGGIESASPCRIERISEPNNGSSINVSRDVILVLS
ncbi:hypothetical protein [Acaryochloris marina]|uniref:hypothetical protein n=1 Tax=Acaryochloris marina TaxID=155978 RepID=UPI0020183AA8|nr:hypothetical protein [Acaryochloris marina]